MAENKLPAEVAEEFECLNPTLIRTPWGEELDLRTISVEKARELHSKGLQMLKLKAPAATKAEDVESKKKSKH